MTGSHRRAGPISEGLARRLMENGMPQNMVESLQMEVKVKEGELI